MAKLTTSGRNRMKVSTFALPARRAYPIPDKSHAANAKARATQMHNAGKLSAADKVTVFRKANAKLGKSAGGYAKSRPGYEGSKADLREDTRQAKARGIQQREWEGSPADEALDRLHQSPGGYLGDTMSATGYPAGGYVGAAPGGYVPNFPSQPRGGKMPATADLPDWIPVVAMPSAPHTWPGVFQSTTVHEGPEQGNPGRYYRHTEHHESTGPHPPLAGANESPGGYVPAHASAPHTWPGGFQPTSIATGPAQGAPGSYYHHSEYRTGPQAPPHPSGFVSRPGNVDKSPGGYIPMAHASLPITSGRLLGYLHKKSLGGRNMGGKRMGLGGAKALAPPMPMPFGSLAPPQIMGSNEPQP